MVQPTAPDTPAKKKHKANPNPFASAYSRLVDKLELFASFLASNAVPPSPTLYLNQLRSIEEEIADFKREKAGDEGELQGTKWKDKLDSLGTVYWNQSTALRHAVVKDSVGEVDSLRVVAHLRLTAYHLIELGSIGPLTLATRIQLLSFSTKTSLAFLLLPAAVTPTETTSALLSSAASHAEFLLHNSDNSIESNRAVLSHYIARVRASAKEENWTVARWVMGKAEEVVGGGRLGGREVEELAFAAYGIGSSLLRSSTSNGKDIGESNSGASIVWLLEASDLLENREEGFAKDMHLSTLECLAQAYLSSSPARSGWPKAEEVLTQLLALRPSSSTTLWRRQIKLIIARGGGDGEIGAAFENAAKVMPWSQSEGSSLLGEMHHLSNERRLVKFKIIASLLDVACSRYKANESETSTTLDVEKPEDDSYDIGTGASAFVAQCLMAIIFAIDADDKSRIVDLFDRIALAAPSLRIAPNPAFVCSTFLWRQGDKAHQEKSFKNAAEWYLLGTHTVLESLDEKTRQKSYRKAALCFSEVGLYERADEAMGSCSGLSAKNDFVRFYNATLRVDESQAIASLKSLATAPDFEVKMLLWAAKTAHESNIKTLLVAVLETILVTSQKQSAVVDVDLLVLVRCLVRILLPRLDDIASREEVISTLLQHLETALQLARNVDPAEKSITKDMIWLFKTAYGVCARFTSEWTTSQLIAFYSISAALAEFVIESTPNVDGEIVTGALHCRFAVLAGKMEEARNVEINVDRVAAFYAILPLVAAFKIKFDQINSTSPNLPRLSEIGSAVVAVELECLFAVEDWTRVLEMYQSFVKPEAAGMDVRLIKAIPDKVMESENCPPEIVSEILKNAPALLVRRNALNSNALAGWYRLIVTYALRKRLLDDGFSYAQQALTFLQSKPNGFPKEEIAWLVAASWDEGLNHFSASDIERGTQWCGIALAATKFHDQPALGISLRSSYEKLCTRYSISA